MGIIYLYVVYVQHDVIIIHYTVTILLDADLLDFCYLKG